MRITRAMAAAAVAAALALAGCSAAGETDAAGSQGGSTSGAPQTGSAASGSSGSGEPSAGASSDGGSASGSASGPGSTEPSGSGAAGSGQATPTPDIDDVPKVVASVNGEDIDRDEFVSTYESQFQRAAAQQQASGGDVDQDKLKKQVADQLVNNKLLLQAADKAGIKPSDKDIQDTLDEAAQQNGLDSAEDLISAMKKQGVSKDEIQDDAASQYKVTTYIDQKADISDPTDKELHQRYDQLVDQMGGSDAGSSGSASSGSASSGSASSAPSSGASEGSGSGESAGSGDSSANIPDFDDVRDQIAKQIKTEKRNKAASNILDKLRDKADITINL